MNSIVQQCKKKKEVIYSGSQVKQISSITGRLNKAFNLKFLDGFQYGEGITVEMLGPYGDEHWFKKCMKKKILFQKLRLTILEDSFFTQKCQKLLKLSSPLIKNMETFLGNHFFFFFLQISILFYQPFLRPRHLSE